MKKGLAITGLSSLIVTNCFRGTCAFVLLICFGQGAVSGQQAQKNGGKVPIEDATRATNQQETIARLFGVVNELKSESDKSAAALLQSEVADVLWRFDEPAARSIFRQAFDTLRQVSPNNSSSIDPKAKGESRRWTSAIKTILKRYGSHDRKSAEAWLKEFESEIKAERTTSGNSGRISKAQAELLAEMALGLVSRDPKEAQRIGLLVLTAEGEVPWAFYRLLMALRDTDKTLSDVLLRQAFMEMRTKGFNYDSVLVPLTNYAFFSNGSPVPDVLPADVRLVVQYLVDAASAQAARWRSGLSIAAEEQTSRQDFVIFLTSRAMPIVALNSPDKLALLQSNVGELTQGMSAGERQQAEMAASLSSQNSGSLAGNDSDIESRIHRAEQEKNGSTRNLLLRNLVLWLMRTDPEQALEVAEKIDDAEVRAQTEDDVYLALMQKAFRGRSYEEARKLALKMNDAAMRAKWLAEIASQVSSRSKDHTEAADLLSQAYSIAAKSDNTPAKLEVLLLIAKEFVRFDQDRGFDILSDAVDTANRLEKVQSKPNHPSGSFIKVISITVVDGKEVSSNDRATVDSLDFNQISAFAERDYLRTSALGGDIKDHFFRAKYFIALARSILHVPRQGPAYERTLEDMISN